MFISLVVVYESKSEKIRRVFAMRTSTFHANLIGSMGWDLIKRLFQREIGDRYLQTLIQEFRSILKKCVDSEIENLI